jgi:osmotically inducible lipoprotein OsmB
MMQCEIAVLDRGLPMKTNRKVVLGAVAAVMVLGLGGCAGMSTQDKNTAIGAGVGAVGGAVLTGGSAVGTVGGAAVGGVIGHEVNKPK